MSEIQKWTMSVPEAGRKYYDIGRDASYAAAKAGNIPTIRVGKLLRVPIRAMERKMEAAGVADKSPSAMQPGG
jgi:hypothetical protein